MLLGLMSAVDMLLRDEQTDHTRHLRSLEKKLKGEAEITRVAWLQGAAWAASRVRH